MKLCWMLHGFDSGSFCPAVVTAVASQSAAAARGAHAVCGLAFRPSQLRRAAPQESSVLLPLSETLEVLLRRKGELGACPAVIASPPQTRLFQREERLRAVTGPGRAG